MSAKLIPVGQIESRILLFRGLKVILDSDLATLYGVETKALNQAIKRNLERFPSDFCFQLTKDEVKEMISMRSQIVTSKFGSGGRRYFPFVFTEQGVAMLSGVLRSPRAVQVNIEIMRAFVRLRQWLASNAELTARLVRLEKNYDRKFKVVFEAIRELMRDTKAPKRSREIGFHTIQAPPGGQSGTKALTRSLLA